jgi:hypothetical protein
MKEKTYIFHEDPGHGWLAVKLKELQDLNIVDKISSCSYIRGKTAYLEEDCDLSIFMEAREKAGKPLNINDTKRSFQEHTPIRGYDLYDSSEVKTILEN